MSGFMLSEHLALADATKSATAMRKGIDNTPNPATIGAMQLTAAKVFEPLYRATGGKIRVNSFYRSPALNVAIGGSTTSQHMLGEAIDLDAVAPYTNAELLALAKALPEFDQVIHEYGTDTEPAWVHVSYRAGRNRRQVLRVK